MSNKQEILYGLCIVALALQLTSVSTEHWSVCNSSCLKLPNISAGGADGAIGLWKACGEVWGKAHGISGDVDVCLHLPIDGLKSFPKNSLYAARAFSLMGIILIFMSLVCMMYMKNYKRCQLVCLIAGGLSALIANAIWAAELLKFKVNDSSPSIKFNPGYSFYLNMIGGLVALVAAYYYYSK